MLSFLQNFLKPRSLKVKVKEFLSDTKVQTEDISQGSVVSPTFFILKINKIVAQLPNDNRFQISLYMDVLKMSYRHPKWRVVERKVQEGTNIVEKFAQKYGFKFSISKTGMPQFGANVSAQAFWRGFFGAGTFWRKYALAPTFWCREILASHRFGA